MKGKVRRGGGVEEKEGVAGGEKYVEPVWTVEVDKEKGKGTGGLAWGECSAEAGVRPRSISKGDGGTEAVATTDKHSQRNTDQQNICLYKKCCLPHIRRLHDNPRGPFRFCTSLSLRFAKKLKTLFPNAMNCFFPLKNTLPSLNGQTRSQQVFLSLASTTRKRAARANRIMHKKMLCLRSSLLMLSRPNCSARYSHG